MSRRRRIRVAPKGNPNLKLIAMQIIAMAIALVAVLFLTYRFSSGTSHLVDYLSGEDLTVENANLEEQYEEVSLDENY